MWLRLVIEYICRAAVVVAPLLVPKFMVLGVARFLPFLQGKPEQQIEDTLRVAVSLLGLVGVFGFDIFNLYIPRQQARQFARDYFNRCIVEIRKRPDIPALGEHIRLNVLFAPRLRFVRCFKWTANVGFEPPVGYSRDGHLWLFTWQGICGRALKLRETQFVDLRTLPINRHYWLAHICPMKENFRLFSRQLRKTRHVRAVLSVPIFEQRLPSPNPRFRAIGVFNIDAVTDEGSDWLSKDRKSLTVYFADQAQLFAYMK